MLHFVKASLFFPLLPPHVLSLRPQSLQEDRTHCSKSMTNINQRLQEIFGEAIRASYPELDNPPLAIAPNQQAKFGDYQCNSAMAMAQVRLPIPSVDHRKWLFNWG